MSEQESKPSSLQPESRFLNRGLFSDHFLKARLPQWKEWQCDGELSEFRKKLVSLYESTKAILPMANEAQTEKEFVQPVLDLLGYAGSYIVQAPTQIGEHTNRPDYALFPDQAAKNKAYGKLKDNDYTLCICVADAKYWERELDLAKTSPRDTFTNQNPSFQIHQYLVGTKQTWGILTNGRLWRLYCAKSHLPLGNYYQVDLLQLLDAPEEALKYFYLFFRKAALIQVDGKSFLDRVLEDSNQYAVELEADIKERAYEVVELLCRGFAAGFSTDQLTGQTLRDIYDNSLTLLYRLLFVFYAEARDLLPLTANQTYRDKYSLHRLTQEIDEALAKDYHLSAKSTVYYNRARDLFKLISEGDPDLGVPEYNGGLFNPEEHPFLENHSIADAFLVRAIHQLARIQDKKLGREVAVDYNTLSELHLGSIYEGLLEFKPRIADSDLVIIKEKGSIKYAPAEKHPEKKVAYKKGELYLANDKGERKASGSYYTPEYIVNYIVENTLDPLAKEAQEKVRALKPEVDKAIAKWEKLKEQKQGLEPTEKYDRAIAEERERLLEPYLSLKVLDPAMGSGHFLARATDYLAEAIATDPYIKPPGEIGEDSELTYWRRRVVESCIYGVDLNPLAVELAKLTLWLKTMAKSKPLSFLNHHLRVGNSLIGARVADLDEIPKAKPRRGKAVDLSRAPVQLGLFQEAFNKKLYDLLQNRALIAQFPTETLEDVHKKEKWERDFEHNMRRFRILADLWISTYFGNSVAWDTYNTLVENLQSPEPNWEKLLQKESVQKATAMGEEKRFFHWELEFPEVFYDEKGNRKPDAGFDAVIGNPPYVGFHGFADVKPVLHELFITTRGKFDIYIPFWERSLALLREGGVVSFICPSGFMKREHGIGLRELVQKHKLVALHDFEHAQVFEGVTNYTCIPKIIKGREKTEIVNTMVTFGSDPKSPEFQLTAESLVDQVGGWVLPSKTSVATNIMLTGPHILPLNKVADIIAEGIVTGKNDVFLLDSKKWSNGKLESVIRPALRGECVDRYEIDWDGTLLIYPYKIVGENTTVLEETALATEAPKTYKYLTKSKARLKGRPYFERSGKLWYELWNQRNMSHQSQPKLVVQENSVRCEFVYDPGEYFYLDTCCGLSLPSESPLSYFYLLNLLNSSLVDFAFRKVTVPKAGGHFIHKPMYLQQIPIRRINFTTTKKERKQLLAKGKKLYQRYLASHDWGEVLAFVGECLPQKADGTPDTEHEKSDVVHDLLAFLAEEMTRLNKEKQSKIKGFLTWLEKEILKGSVEDQKNKTRIKDFHNGTFEDLLDVLKKNKVVPDPCPSSIRDTIASEFSAAVNALTPLKTQIEATDSLIDRVVYRLYGLTEAEIAIVEGAKTS